MVRQVVIERPRARGESVGPESIQALTRVYSLGDVDAVDEVFAPSYIDHDPAAARAGQGVESVKQLVGQYRTAFPDLRLSIAECDVEADTVIIRWAGHGTQTGPLEDIAPTGKRATLRGVTVTRFEDGKAVEAWSNWETAALLRELDVSPGSITWRRPPHVAAANAG